MGCLLFLSNTTYTYDGANTYCHSLGAKQVEILTEFEMEYLHATLKTSEAALGKHRWWTSATDGGTEGVWMWASSYTAVGDFVWGAGEPETSSFNCMILTTVTGYMGHTVPCENEYNKNPICQIK
jgi:hypothetical protein